MDLNGFLEEGLRYKFVILRYIEMRKDYPIKIDEICDFCGLSPYRVKQALNEISGEMKHFSDEARIDYSGDTEIMIFNLDGLLIKKMRLSYLEQSDVFKLFRYILTTEGKLKDFSASHFLSKSKTYQIKSQLLETLKTFGITYKHSQFKGPELAIRNLAYTVYFEFYNGLASPFNEQVEEAIQRVIEQLQKNPNFQTTTTTYWKLTFFLGVSLERMRCGHILPADTIDGEDVEADIVAFAAAYQFTRTEVVGELQLLRLFLFTQEILQDSKAEALVQNAYFSEDEKAAESTAQLIFTETRIKKFTTPEEYLQFYEVFKRLILRANLKNRFFYNSMETFSTEYSFMFFDESYPLITKVIRRAVDSIDTTGPFGQDIRVRLYYDYLLALLSVLDISQLEEPIYVCVDFSHGSAYTKYISDQVANFVNLNVRLQRHINRSTDLYLSDFAIDGLQCEQIIWKSPPTANDWEQFGDVVMGIKEKREPNT